MLAYFISGYGMTKGIIDTAVATRLHITILPVFVILSFIIHSFLSIRLAFIRWKIWNRFSLAVVALLFAAFSVSVIYVEMFYTSTQIASAEQTAIATQVVEQVPSPADIKMAVTTQKVFNSAELASYNGRNGMAPYVAVDGLVYDMSRIFRQGRHFEHVAGKELTSAFYSFHVQSEITKYPVVGIYKG